MAFGEKDEKQVIIRFKFIIYKKKGGKEGGEKGFLDFLMKQKDNDDKENFDFWRGNLLIKNASKGKNKSSDYAVIIIIDDNPLSKLLRKLENASHTEWQTKSLSQEVKDEYKYISNLVTFIKQLPNKIISVLKDQNIKLDDNLFSDYFPDTRLKGNKSQGVGLKETENSGVNPIASNPNFVYRENRKENGFIISLSEKGKEPLISDITITVAYATNKGDAFKHYKKEDFDFAKKTINIIIEKGKQEKKSDNEIICKIKNKDFKITISGFDPDRELKIDIKENQI